MIFRLTLSVLLLFSILANLFSRDSTVTIYGNNPAYAGQALEFFVYRERVFDSYETLAETVADSSGSFRISFSTRKILCVYCQTPLYTAYIYTEPGCSYLVEMPSFQGTDNQADNPFFIPPLWHLVPGNSENDEISELNAAINKFNKQFEPFLDKQILRYYNPQQSKEKLDSFQLAIINTSENYNNEYLKTYIDYKMASLGFLVNQFSHNDLFEKYLKDKPARPDVPSWWEFFNLYYDGYFSSLVVKKDFYELYSLVGKGSYSTLNQLLNTDPALQNDHIREWVILKEIYNAYYQDGLPQTTLFALCDSLKAATTDALSISMAETLKKKISSLIPGNRPPVAFLQNNEGDSLEISGLRGKYSYIGFCSLGSIECQQEFEYLKYLYHKHGKYVDIIVILPKAEKDRIASFTDENSIPWKFWYGRDDRKVRKDYQIKAFPVFYLLDKEGILIHSPAILPSDGFEQQLFGILKGKGEI